ncbi:putative phage tail protein [Vibrio chagasii]|nr:putative phage tail protein [Vibrio chagasii]CAH6947239.1 putative phage tail protein [Vibrio chagasii]CAH7037379.1 putative phage tail protein [Vibrio chagasii]CAH7039978.1 putative phage tail protein [Vibrio chagasii]CAH7144316.1 putative phage tail protein [Vibrio chagasii]
MNQLTMQIDGLKHPFYEANLHYSVEQLAHTFRCSIVPLEIVGPVPVEFFLNDKSILVGQIDSADSEMESSAQSVSITGRSKSANMIDSRITMDALYDLNVEDLLRRMAKPFGLEVKSLVKEMPMIPEFQINAESPVANVAQLIREQGFVLIERRGVLTIENTAHAIMDNIGLEVGKSIESLSIKRMFNQQFHTIDVQGAWDEASAQITNPNIQRTRTMAIVSDQLQTADACLSRAKHEKNLAIARSLTASSSIADVFPELAIDGLNRVIRVKDEEQNFSEMLVIKSLELSVSKHSARTAIELFRPFKEQSHV